MIAILAMVLMVLGIFSWVLAMISAVQLVRLSPAGTRMKTYGRLGWWRFAEIRAAAGPAADPHIRVYQRAFIAFIVCIVLAIAIASLIGLQAQN